jgi:hypothetical protein
VYTNVMRMWRGRGGMAIGRKRIRIEQVGLRQKQHITGCQRCVEHVRVREWSLTCAVFGGIREEAKNVLDQPVLVCDDVVAHP